MDQVKNMLLDTVRIKEHKNETKQVDSEIKKKKYAGKIKQQTFYL